MMRYLTPLLLVAIACGAPTPKFKWWQDTSNLYISIDATRCDGVPGSAAISTEGFKWSCNEKQTLEFELREDVVPESSHCKAQESSRGTEELCQLTKRFPHHFDRLTFSKAPGAIKRQMTTDWGRMKSTAPEKPHNEGYEEEEDLVPSVTAAELGELTEEHVLVAADIMYPWCEQHGAVATSLIKAAMKLQRNSKIKVVYINALEERQLVKSLNVTCEQSARIHLYRKGEPRFVLTDTVQPFEATELVKALKRFVKPVSSINTDDELSELSSSGKPTVVGVVSDKSDEATFKSVARSLILKNPSTAPVVVTADLQAFSNRARPFVVVYANGSEPYYREEGSWDVDMILKWSNIHTRPPVIQFGFDARKSIEELELPIAQVWLGDKGQPKELEILANKYRGKLVFVQMDRSESFMMEGFGFGGKDLQNAIAFGIGATLQYNEKRKYGWDGDTLDDAGLEQFIQDFLDNKLKPSIKSTIAPSTPPAAGIVNAAVGNSVATLAQDHTLVLGFFKSYNDGVKTVEKAMATVASLCKDVEGLLFAKLDTTSNGFDPELFQNVDEFHSDTPVFLVPKGGRSADRVWKTGQFTAEEYGEMRDAMLLMLKNKVDAVEKEWERIQVEVEKEDTQIREELEAKRKAEEEKYANAREVKVEDGITKYVFTEGAEDASVPQDGDEVTAHYTGTLASNGEKFDSSVDRGDPFKFTLGQGMVISCWDKGFATMKTGEKAELKCDSAHAYGDRGSPPKIPGGATLKFEVELISFESKNGKSKSEL